MKKAIKVYSIIWAICLALFNVIVFVSSSEAGAYNKFGGAFGVGYIFITIAFIGQLVCAIFALKEDKLQKVFYNIPLIRISYTGLVLMLIVGTACMAIPDLPNWVGIIVCLLILAFNAIAVIKASVAAEIVGGIDEKVKVQTSIIRDLTVEAQNLVSSATTDEIREEAKRVYEAIRYSDPMSNPLLSGLETQILSQFNAFAEAVRNEDSELTKSNADSLLKTIDVRNQKIKLMK